MIAGVSAVILLAGWILRPEPRADRPAPMASEGELARLARLAQRRSLEDTAGYFSEVADSVQRSLVHVPTVHATGVAWESGVVVTPRVEDRVPDTLMVATGTTADRGRVTAWGPRLPLAVVRLPESVRDLVTVGRRDSALDPGEWVVAVWRTDAGRVFAPATYLQVSPSPCGEVVVEEVLSTLALTRPMAGGGLFDVDGDLIAVLLPCDGRLAAVGTRSVDAVLGRATALERRLVAQYGIDVGLLSGAEAEYFGVSEGVIVRELWTGYIGDQAGLLPGDVIVALNGRRVVEPADLEALASPPGAELSEVVVHRAQEEVHIVLSRTAPSRRREAAGGSDAGFVWEPVQPGYRIVSVRPGSPAAAAGIDPGDRLVRLNGDEPPGLDAVERALEGDDALPAFVEVERDGRRLGFLLQ